MGGHVYKYSALGGVFTVGYYDPAGAWVAVKDFSSEVYAAHCASVLNGSSLDFTEFCKMWTTK